MRQLLNQAAPDPQLREIQRFFRESSEQLEFLSSITLIDAEFVRKMRDVLNDVYGAKVEQFTFAPYRGQFKLHTTLSNRSVHIDDYGDGFRYAFAILSLASQIHDTALLLEELKYISTQVP